jgi:GNAT superfamily N-acetyltransferase
VHVRATRSDDGLALQDVERRAGEGFRTLGLDPIADHEPASLDELAGYARNGRAWTAVDDADHPVGYVLVDEVDGNAHIEQMSVVPEHQGAGIGRALLDVVRHWAIATERSCITLTTFADVPWNRPLYEHLGFQVLATDEIGPGLSAVRWSEAEHGLDPAARVCMRLDVA